MNGISYHLDLVDLPCGGGGGGLINPGLTLVAIGWSAFDFYITLVPFL